MKRCMKGVKNGEGSGEVWGWINMLIFRNALPLSCSLDFREWKTIRK